MRRRLVLGLGLLLVFTLTSTAAYAKFRGSDMWENLMPGGGTGGLADRYPISHYQLDYHVDNGVTGLSDPGNTFAQFTASWLFFLAALMMRVVISIFDWSFHVDLITGERGLLSVSNPAAQHYYHDIVMPFLISGAIAFGVWIAYQATKHKHADIGGTVMRVVVMSVVAIAILQHPQETIGRAYGMVSDVGESIVTAGQGKATVTDRVFETFIYRPWAILQFSGLRVCTGAKQDQDGFPLAANKSNPAKTCHSVLRQDADGHGDYARRFIRWGHGTDERDAEYDALRSGSSPGGAQFVGTTIDRTDAPAVDMMQAEGSVQRLIYTVLIVFGMIGGVAMLGLLSIAALFMQLALAMLFLATPFMVLVALLPPAHFVFERWARMLGKVLVGSIFYSLLLAVVITTSTGLLAFGDAAGGARGYFVAFVGQAILFWGVFLMRKRILESVSSKAAKHYEHHESQAASFVGSATVGAAAAISGGTTELATAMRAGWSGKHGGDEEEKSEHRPDSVSPPASAGRDYSPPGTPTPAPAPETGGDTSAPAETITAPEEPVTNLMTFQDHLQSARQSAPQSAPAAQQEPPAPTSRRRMASETNSSRATRRTAHTTSPPRGLSTPQSFQEDLEMASLAYEKPKPQEQDEPWERVRERDELER
jgi:hypothetical protein